MKRTLINYSEKNSDRTITLTVFFDGQFYVGLFEREEDGKYSAARVIFAVLGVYLFFGFGEKNKEKGC